jgi:hypothetical protein
VCWRGNHLTPSLFKPPFTCVSFPFFSCPFRSLHPRPIKTSKGQQQTPLIPSLPPALPHPAPPRPTPFHRPCPPNPRRRHPPPSFPPSTCPPPPLPTRPPPKPGHSPGAPGG